MEDIRNYESLSVQQKWNVLATVANLYYNSELTQNQIAERLYTSRSKVSRMLKEARELGIVEIYIREPWERNLEYEKNIKDLFALRNIRVVTVKDMDRESGAQKIAEAASYYLDSIVKQGMVVGISWGNTLYRIVKYISTNNSKNIPITVVPIMGAANIKSPEKDAMDLAKDLASAYGGKYQYIYAPLFVNNKELKDSLVQEENIKSVLELSANADAILTSVGSIVYKSWNNYLSVKTLEALEAKGAVGHIGGHFYDIQGRELETSLAERMIGISLDDIRNCREVVCTAFGESKAEAVLGAMRGELLNTLITDEKCAHRILELVNQ
ncbi:MAG: sugar-binding transcriptional regulator [Lachnoclostridium sp.]|nr:sugar-binding transcriptional regulator [Lachnoclostridium sp.]